MLDTTVTGQRVSLKRQIRMRLYSAILLVDAAAVSLGFWLARYLQPDTWQDTRPLGLFVATIVLFVLLEIRNLRPSTLEQWLRGTVTSLASLMGALLLAVFVSFCLNRAAYVPRLFAGGSLLLSGTLLILFRTLLGSIGERALGGSAVSRLVVLDGMAIDLPRNVATLDAHRIDPGAGTPHPYFLDRLAQALKGVDEAFIACLPERRAFWAVTMKGSAVRTELLVPELDQFGVIGNKHFAGIATALVSTGALPIRERLMKRILDLAIVIPAIIVLAPLLLAVFIAVKLDSPGSAFFVQPRVGYGNRLFPMFKFRSMRAELSDTAGAQSTSRNDKRVTRVGKLIRATSIDELPQLFNILRGDMSFVGPRPHALGSLAGDQLFWEVDPRYHHRHACKPGLTGLAQVRGFRGATHRTEDLTNRLDADLEYINDWSVVRDIQILIATFKVLVHRNAF
ncbi:sugar transferase [Sphingomonas sp. RHCKR47]|uniref:sugar transferase n=1 Tax=Sphingomonas citricola TaxID=2862498 RepID=UPI001CA5A9CA|nr:sugar transferase [Sphingomonas citricola]MBW6525064.1 sugar transferase [Sphingomonas citricola]